MLLFIDAHKVRWVSVLTLFCDVLDCCCLQRVMIKCIDLILCCYYLLLLKKWDCLVFRPDFVMLLFVVAHKV